MQLWVAMDADTNRVPCVAIGSRDAADAHAVISDLALRLRYRVQMTTDGYRPCLEAIESAFGPQIDYAPLGELYGNTSEPRSPELRYSPAKVIGTMPTGRTKRQDAFPKEESVLSVSSSCLRLR